MKTNVGGAATDSVFSWSQQYSAQRQPYTMHGDYFPDPSTLYYWFKTNWRNFKFQIKPPAFLDALNNKTTIQE